MVVSLLEVYSLGLQPCVTSSLLERMEVNEVAEARRHSSVYLGVGIPPGPMIRVFPLPRLFFLQS